MTIKLNVLLSLETGNLFIKDKEWEELMNAEEFLLRNLKFLDVDESELISSYLIDCFPETAVVCTCISEGEDIKTTAWYISQLPKTYKISPIPIDYQIKSSNREKAINNIC